MNQSKIQTLLLGILAVAAVCTLGWLVLEPPADPTASNSSAEPGLAEFVEELRALRADLDLRPAAVSGGSPPSGTNGGSTLTPELRRERLDGDALERLTTAIENLERALRDQPAGEQGIGASIPASFLQYARATVNWEEFLRIEQLYEQDSDLANKAVQFLSAREVMERFGRPHSVYMNDGGMSWNYTQAPTEADQDRYAERDEDWLDVSMQLYDGFVLWIDMSR